MCFPMDPDISELERAFQLATSGTCTDVSDIHRKLRAEGYPGSQIEGPTLRKQLREMIAKARENVGSQ